MGVVREGVQCTEGLIEGLQNVEVEGGLMEIVHWKLCRTEEMNSPLQH